LKRYRRSLPLGRETDKIVTSRDVLRGVGAEWLLDQHWSARFIPKLGRLGEAASLFHGAVA
jgi:hypothetical protein